VAGSVPLTNSNDIIGYRTRDITAFSAVPKQTAPTLAPVVLFDSYFCRNESLRLNRNWDWAFFILKLCDSEPSLSSTIKFTIYQLSPSAASVQA